MFRIRIELSILDNILQDVVGSGQSYSDFSC